MSEKDEYVVHTEGFVNVEAEDREEAQELAQEEVHSLDGHHEVIGYSPENIDDKEDQFQVQLKRSGRPHSNAGYDLMTSQSALELLFQVNTSLAQDLVGEDMDKSLVFNFAKFYLAMYEYDEEEAQELAEEIIELGEAYDEEGMMEVIQKEFTLEKHEEHEESEDDEE